MSDSSVSPTPSQENLANTMDAAMYNAIDTFMANEEQSYDNFMKQFTHFTKEDVKAQMLQKRQNMMKKTQGNKPQSSVENSSQTSYKPGGNHHVDSQGTDICEELEEEILEGGTTSSVLSNRAVKGPGTSGVKFDNFVDVEEEDGDGLEDSEYIASFADNSSSVQSEASVKKKDSGGEVTPEISPDKDLVTEPSDTLLNPGEVEVLPKGDQSVTIVDTTLDFSSRYHDGIPPVKGDQKICSDEVEPFSLDADFDYDNVILTPKYSTSDVELMRTLSEQNMEQGNNAEINET